MATLDLGGVAKCKLEITCINITPGTRKISFKTAGKSTAKDDVDNVTAVYNDADNDNNDTDSDGSNDADEQGNSKKQNLSRNSD